MPQDKGMEVFDVSPHKMKVLMQALYDSDDDEASDLHDELVNLGFGRFEANKGATLTYEERNGGN